MSLTFVSAAPPQVHALHTEIDLPGALTPQLEVKLAAPLTDVRVHGPPPGTL